MLLLIRSSLSCLRFFWFFARRFQRHGGGLFAIYLLIFISTTCCSRSHQESNVVPPFKKNQNKQRTLFESTTSSTKFDNKTYSHSVIRSLDDDTQQQQQRATKGSNDDDGLIAILHIGPMKTGSTAIQSSMKNALKELSLDNYDAAHISIKDITHNNRALWNFVACFRRDDPPCAHAAEDVAEHWNRRQLRNTGISDKLQEMRLDATKSYSDALENEMEEYYFMSSESRLDEGNRMELESSVEQDDRQLTLSFNLVCHNDTFDIVRDIGRVQRKNVVISAEYLTHPGTDLTALKSFLSPYWSRFRIVAYYRRYYDWLLSFHNQGNKKKLTSRRQTLYQFIQREAQFSYFYERMYLVDAVSRYSEYFDDIKLINMYDVPNNDIVEAFYCEGMINAPHMCDKQIEVNQMKILEKQRINTDGQRRQTQQLEHGGDKYHRRNKKDNEREEPKKAKVAQNPSIDLVYSDLAYHAYQMKLWKMPSDIEGSSSTEPPLEVVEQISNLAMNQFKDAQAAHESSYEFIPEAYLCPEQEILDIIYERSSKTEQDWFPEYYNRMGKEIMFNEYQLFIQQKKFCHIDATIILQQQKVWSDFFVHLVFEV